MAKATIKTYKNSEAITLSFNKITPGECLSIYNALFRYSEYSAVAEDVRCYLKNAAQDHPELSKHMG